MYTKYAMNAHACLFIFLRTGPGLASGAKQPARRRDGGCGKPAGSTAESPAALASILLRARGVTVVRIDNELYRDDTNKAPSEGVSKKPTAQKCSPVQSGQI